MRKNHTVLPLAMLVPANFFSLIITAAFAPNDNQANLLLINGTVYTVNEKVDWNRDLFKQPPEEINRAEVLTTLLEGREVFGAFKENETISLEAGELAKLSKAYKDLFKDVAREDISQANGLLAELARRGTNYKNST